jgi:hypothetical protein
MNAQILRIFKSKYCEWKMRIKDFLEGEGGLTEAQIISQRTAIWASGCTTRGCNIQYHMRDHERLVTFVT